MEFKRCSVDGHIFGMPIAKAAPTQLSEDKTESELTDSVHPLKNLLVTSDGSGNLKETDSSQENADTKTQEPGSIDFGKKLTFNAEMFLRVMSICHTVVVEKDHKTPENETDGKKSARKSKLFKSKKSNPGSNVSNGAESSSSNNLENPIKKSPVKKKKDGAPEGSNYQAESPDEGALVSAASNEYGFQLIGRDSSGVQISCPCSSLFEDEKIVEGIKSGTISAKSLAEQTMTENPCKYSDSQVKATVVPALPRIETWSILAINKFDSDRKRMSVLVRSPTELGSIPLLLCKGADSSMLLEGVCEGLNLAEQIDGSNLTGDNDAKALLGLQSHLGGKTIISSIYLITLHGRN